MFQILDSERKENVYPVSCPLGIFFTRARLETRKSFWLVSSGQQRFSFLQYSGKWHFFLKISKQAWFSNATSDKMFKTTEPGIFNTGLVNFPKVASR